MKQRVSIRPTKQMGRPILKYT